MSELVVTTDRVNRRITIETADDEQYIAVLTFVSRLMMGAGPAEPTRGRPERRPFGKRLRVVRRRLKVTIDELAAASGISNAGISRIETGGVQDPRAETVHAICGALLKLRRERSVR